MVAFTTITWCQYGTLCWVKTNIRKRTYIRKKILRADVNSLSLVTKKLLVFIARCFNHLASFYAFQCKSTYWEWVGSAKIDLLFSPFLHIYGVFGGRVAQW